MYEVHSVGLCPLVPSEARFQWRMHTSTADFAPLWQGITGSKMEKACDLCHITLNKNAVVGDVSALAPGGVRIGAPAMTSRYVLQLQTHCCEVVLYMYELLLSYVGSPCLIVEKG